MARFANLHDAGAAVASYIRRNLNPTLQDVMAGPPIENATTAGESIRVSLMWVTPQPTHRNDPWITGDDGQSHPPPVSLSAFYLITAYGTPGAGEPTQAINRLGQAIQVIETGPVIEMPLPDDPTTPAADPVPGEGRMSAALLPTAADLMEKVFTPLQMRHRPWAMIEVGPIQLERLVQPVEGPDIVAPGGVRLAGPRPITEPRIAAVSPARLRPGGRLRLDTLEAAGAETLRLGDQVFRFVDAPGAADEIARPDAEGRVFVTYPAGGPEGDIDAVLRAADMTSAPAPLSIAAAGLPGLDAPDARLDPGADLTLTGAELGAADRVYLWPDRGVAAPAEVIDLAPDSVAPTQVTVARTALDAAGLRALRYRAALRIGPNRFTAFVILEVAP